MEDLLPVKQAMDAIHKECLFDDRIEFDRFKLVGQDTTDNLWVKYHFIDYIINDTAYCSLVTDFKIGLLKLGVLKMFIDLMMTLWYK